MQPKPCRRPCAGEPSVTQMVLPVEATEQRVGESEQAGPRSHAVGPRRPKRPGGGVSAKASHDRTAAAGRAPGAPSASSYGRPRPPYSTFVGLLYGGGSR